MIFLVFVLFIFLVSRAIKVFFHALIIAAAGFAFPWFVQFAGINIGFAPTIENGILFAAAATSLFFAYNFLHFIYAALKIITWPVRKILNMAEENELEEMKKEVKEIIAKRMMTSPEEERTLIRALEAFEEKGLL